MHILAYVEKVHWYCLISVLPTYLQQYGLWKSDKNPTLSNACLMFLKSVKIFFTRLLSPHITQGVKDYYTSMLFFDVLCFLTIVFGVNSFGVGIQGSSGVTVANYIKTNYIPLPFVIILLLQFLSMLVDRAIYLRRSILTKLVFQIILLVGWHVWLFFILPSDNVSRQPFTKNAAAQCIYFFKCCYFIVSSLQIAAGYPTCILSNFLTRSYDVFTWLIFLVYELIPLLPELRKVMDWVFIDTTLSLLNWLKVQEIYAQLYYVKVQRSRELVFPRFLGERQGWVLKLLSGFLVVAGLVLLIWGPLLVMSLISTSSQANPPVEVSIKLALNGYQPLVQVTAPQQAVSKLSTVKYNALRNLFIKSPVYPVFESEFSIDDFTHVSFPGVSISLWTISPPSRELLSQNLRSALNGSNEIVIIFSWSVKRKPSSNLAAETVSGTTTHFLQLPESNNTIESFIESLDNRSGITLLSNLYPTIIYAPANSASVNFTQLALMYFSQPRISYVEFVKPSSSSSVSCFTILDSNNTNQEWWSLSCNNSFLEPDNSALHMYIYSEKIAPPVLSSIASIGVIGLYISVVFVIGRLIRAYISGLPLRLYIDEILNPDPLIKLCHDIDLVRECGDFALEEILVGKLFYIFASAKEVGRVTAEVPKLKRD